MLKYLVISLGIGVLSQSSIASAAETVAYTYDARGRLVQVVQQVNSGTPVTTDYTYDKADNRTHVTTG